MVATNTSEKLSICLVSRQTHHAWTPSVLKTGQDNALILDPQMLVADSSTILSYLNSSIIEKRLENNSDDHGFRC